MRFGAASRKSWAQAVIDLTPLIDVVFLLLLFFLLTAAPAPDPTLDVQLPAGRGAHENLPVRDVVVVMKSDGALYVDDAQVDLTGLEARLRQEAARVPAPRVVLRGDRASRYDLFVAILEIAASAGLPLHVAVENPAGKDAP